MTGGGGGSIWGDIGLSHFNVSLSGHNGQTWLAKIIRESKSNSFIFLQFFCKLNWTSWWLENLINLLNGVGRVGDFKAFQNYRNFEAWLNWQSFSYTNFNFFKIYKKKFNSRVGPPLPNYHWFISVQHNQYVSYSDWLFCVCFNFCWPVLLVIWKTRLVGSRSRPKYNQEI